MMNVPGELSGLTSRSDSRYSARRIIHHFIKLMIVAGESCRCESTGAVGANPPQESLRPPYRRVEATLKSSRADRLTDGASGSL